MFTPPPLSRPKRKAPARTAFAGARGECEGCQRGDGKRPCTCVVQDRCNAATDGGAQCILGAGHRLRHVTSTGRHFG